MYRYFWFTNPYFVCDKRLRKIFKIIAPEDGNMFVEKGILSFQSDFGFGFS